MEWDDVVDRYLRIVEVYDAGRLARDLDVALLNVTLRIERLMPSLERMGLRRPDNAILARVKGAAGRPGEAASAS